MKSYQTSKFAQQIYFPVNVSRVLNNNLGFWVVGGKLIKYFHNV